MKKALTIAIALILLSTLCVLTVYADNYASLKMKPLSGTYHKGDQFTIRIYVCDITNNNGIELAEYHIHYNPDVVKYVSSDGGKPSGWDFSSSDYAELWLRNDEETNTFIFAALNPALGQGVKKDGEIYVDLTFELLSNAEKTDFQVTDILFTDDYLVDCQLPDMVFSVTFNNGSNPADTSADDNPSGNTSDGKTNPATSDSQNESNENAGNNSETVNESNGSANSQSGGEEIDQDPNKVLKICLIVSAAVLLAAAAVVAFLIIKKKKAK